MVENLGRSCFRTTKAGASLIAKAGKEYPTEWLKEQGWGKKAPAKKKAAPKKKSRTKRKK